MTEKLLTTATKFFDLMYGNGDETEIASPLKNTTPITPPNSPVGDLSRTTSMKDVAINPTLRADKRSSDSTRTIITGQLTGQKYKLAGTLTAKESKEIFAIELGAKQKTILGEGGFGKVRLAQCEGEWIAVKKMTDINQAQIEIMQHLLVQEKLKASQYIIRLQDYALTTGRDGKPKAYLFMDFINSGFDAILAKAGDLAQLLESQKSFPEFSLKNRLSDLTKQCLEAVRDFHVANLGHGDIKPENFLLDRIGTIKLADYASVASFEEKKLPTSFTIEYMPSALVKELPEKVSGIETKWGQKQRDRFALGVLLLELRNEAQNRSDNTVLIGGEQHNLSTEQIQRGEKEYICHCGLEVNPKTIKGETLDEIIAILLYNQPEGRSVSDVLKLPYFKQSNDTSSECAIL